MRAAWCSMGSFWVSDAPRKWRIVMLKGHVLNAGLSGMECFARKDGPLKYANVECLESVFV
eukprot:4895870-Alexandrium_andersonii.AAC.1